MYIDIKHGNYLLLNKAKITLTCVYLLEQLIEGVDISDLNDLASLSALSTLQRKGYINTKLKVTDAGNKLYLSLTDDIQVVKKIKIKDDKFEEWWETYPSTDDFKYKGKKFPGTQSKKVKKEECLILFNKLLHGGLDADKIISATKYHFDNAKSLSLRKGTNQLSYIANSERYLREKMFEPFIGKVVKDEQQQENKDLTVEL